MSLLKSKAVHGLAGFVLMGSWAAFANLGHPLPAPLVAGVVQGLLTATITVVLKQVIERIFYRTTKWRRFVVPTLVAFSISTTILMISHLLAETPELIATVSVPITVSTIYALSYTLTLSRHV